MKLSKESGIYSITNTANGKRYIGSAANFAIRYRLHLSGLRRGNHHSSKLQNSWNMYGEENFSFEILIKCEKRNLLTYEQLALDFFLPFGSDGYNSLRIAGSSLGRKASPEARAKMALANIGRKASAEVRKKMSESAKLVPAESRRRGAESRTGLKRSSEAIAKTAEAKRGTKHTPESIAKMSASHKNMSDETRRKMSEAAKRMSPETKAKIGLAARNISDETRLKMSIAKKNMSAEQRKKIGEANRRRSPVVIEKMRQKKLGIKQSPEVIAKRVKSLMENRIRREMAKQSGS